MRNIRRVGTRAVRVVSFIALLFGSPVVSTAPAQEPSPSVSLSWGIDTTVTDIRDIVSLVRAYLAKPDSSARSRGLWSTATDFDRRVGDVTTSAYQGFPATIVGILPEPGKDAYVVKVLYATADSARRRITPLALQRLYAVRESGGPFGFRLAGALPRLTSQWERRSKGRMTFLYAPGQKPNVARIAHATAFVDTVATLLGVPAPARLDVYVTASLDEANRAMGFDFWLEGSARGGLAVPPNIILSGDPDVGEAYLHEIVHIVLGSSFPISSWLAGEGVATWLGGSQRRTPRQMYALLHQYQETRPALTLASFLGEDPPDAGGQGWSDAKRATGALVVDTIYRRGGIPALRAFARLSPDTLVGALPAHLGLASADPASLDRWWRTEADRASRVP